MNRMMKQRWAHSGAVVHLLPSISAKRCTFRATKSPGVDRQECRRWFIFRVIEPESTVRAVCLEVSGVRCILIPELS